MQIVLVEKNRRNNKDINVCIKNGDFSSPPSSYLYTLFFAGIDSLQLHKEALKVMKWIKKYNNQYLICNNYIFKLLVRSTQCKFKKLSLKCRHQFLAC